MVTDTTELSLCLESNNMKKISQQKQQKYNKTASHAPCPATGTYSLCTSVEKSLS